MKDLIKTAIVVGTVIVITLLYFFIAGNIKEGVEMLTRNKLDLSDPTILVLQDRIHNNDDLRKANLIPAELSSEDIIKYALIKLDKDSYKEETIKPTKIVCEVTNDINFISSSDCKIRIINNDAFYDFEKKVFNIETELDFKDINYKGLNCKNNGNNYYCLETPYNEEKLGFSLLSEAYEEKGNVYVREYYLRIVLDDNELCNKYFGKDNCLNKTNIDREIISDDNIKEDGVLYEHIFSKNENSFYLKESYIVDER